VSRRHVSYSELADYRQCPYKHFLSWTEGWRPEIEAPQLSKGRAFHNVLAAHYTALKEGRDPRIDAQNVIQPLYEKDGDLADLVGWMYEGYCERYRTDPKWKVLAVEHRDLFWLRTAAGTRSGYRLKTVVDLLVADELGRIWVVDHKTGRNFPKEVALELDDQFQLYAWGLIQRGWKVHGVVYNFARTQRNKGPMDLDARFARYPIYYTPTQLDNTALDAWRTARRIHGGRFVERATDREQCLWRCPFTEACLFGRKGGRIDEFLESQGFVKANGQKGAA